PWRRGTAACRGAPRRLSRRGTACRGAARGSPPGGGSPSTCRPTRRGARRLLGTRPPDPGASRSRISPWMINGVLFACISFSFFEKSPSNVLPFVYLMMSCLFSFFFVFFLLLGDWRIVGVDIREVSCRYLLVYHFFFLQKKGGHHHAMVFHFCLFS